MPTGQQVRHQGCVSARRPARQFALRSLRAQEQEYASEKLSLAQKEALYLDCCAGFNVASEKSPVSDNEYEQLKSDLAFEGSKVILMARDEIKFMVATRRYLEGKPIMDDKEYDTLRKELKERGSTAVTHDAPGCKVDDAGRTVCKADLAPDDGKNALLYTPALVLTALLFNEYTYWVYSWDPLLSLIAGSPIIATITYILTNFIYFQKPYITKAQCPKCTTPQNIYFGDVLFVNGGKPDDFIITQCVNKACGSNLSASRSAMMVTAKD